jgi:hypothetical protein
MKEEITKFIIEFFKSLNAEIHVENETFFVKAVPKDFQNFYGRNEPYVFSFEDNAENKGITEILKPSAFIIGCIKDYLRTKGQTTLIELVFNCDADRLLKKNIILRNCEFSSSFKKEKKDFFIRFSFQIILQHQNEKTIENHSIFIYKGKVAKFNLEDYKYYEGKDTNLSFENLKNEYDLAKSELKNIIAPKISSIGKMLDEKLEKELSRIHQHFTNMKKETQIKTEMLNKEILKIEKLDNRDELVMQKLTKLKKNLEEFNSNESIAKMEKEENFLINDERHKHSLNISTKLINTTILSYPLFILNGYLKNKETARVIEIVYNPLTENINEFLCDGCKKSIKTLNLCSSGHMVCNNCFRGCSQCGRDYCINCLNKICFSCGKKLCRKCSKRCSTCLKDKCPAHISKGGLCLSCEEKTLKEKIKVY